jgi:hypothetical protein
MTTVVSATFVRGEVLHDPRVSSGEWFEDLNMAGNLLPITSYSSLFKNVV